MLPALANAHPGQPVPTCVWQDEDGEIIEPMLAQSPDDFAPADGCDELLDLIASRPSRRQHRPRPDA